MRALVGGLYLTDHETTETETATFATVESAPTSGHVDAIHQRAEDDLLQRLFLHRL